MARLSRSSSVPERSTQRVSELMAELIGQAILYNEQVARTIGISAIDLQAFGVISRHDGPMTPTEVAAQTGLPASTTTRVLDRLESSGYVVSRTIPSDRRKVAVEVVREKAVEIARHYISKVDRIRELNAARSEEELAAVTSYLSALAGEDGT